MTTMNLRIDGARLWDSLMRMASFGATPKGGVRRLALGPEDRAARAQLRDWCERVGYAVRVDAMGNMFARRGGADGARPPVLVGSHLDSQPSGGKFDGALGVMAALEVLRTLDDRDIRTLAPIELVNWTDEEGSRFGHGLLGSGVWSGALDFGVVRALADVDGTSVGAALDGIAGPEPAAPFPADAYFELHIEQGPMLERERVEIGVVTGAQAQIWWDVVVTGQDAHAGTTPPSARRDALVCAARIVDLVDRMMRARGEFGRGTVGRMSVLPNSRNVIPGEVRFSVEFRHPDTAEIDRLAVQFPREAGFIARDCGTPAAITQVFRLEARRFDEGCVQLVREAAAQAGFSARDIVSGAGHDALNLAPLVPSAMIFTPCKDGLSHNEAESITPEQAAAGCQVLFGAVLARAGQAAEEQAPA